jgi:ABC-type sugar transport system substrate-binding protein
MKKIIAILLAFALAFALIACQDTSDSGSSPAGSSGSPSAPAGDDSPPPPPPPQTGSGDDQPPPDTAGQLGYFDPDYDYTQNPRYKIVYLRVTNSPLYEDFANSFKVWAEKMNCDLDVTDTNNDNDLFLTSIETLAGQGYDGILTDPDMDIYQAVGEKCREADILWMPVMGLPKDDDGKLFHPFVGFDYRIAGEHMGQWLVDYQKKTWPDAAPEEIGVIGVDFSAVYEISVRIDGALDSIRKEYPDIDDRYFHADCITGNLDSTTAYTEVGAIIPTQPDIKYWLIVATIDDFADGAITASIDAGMEGSVVAISMGSPGLISQWEAGEQTDWKASLSSIGVIYAEPIFAGLYAQINGDATAEELWNPEWIDNSKGETYANLLLPTIILEYENYQYYKEWVDLYAKIGISNYPVTATLDMFSARVNPPASYAG